MCPPNLRSQSDSPSPVVIALTWEFFINGLGYHCDFNCESSSLTSSCAGDRWVICSSPVVWSSLQPLALNIWSLGDGAVLGGCWRKQVLGASLEVLQFTFVHSASRSWAQCDCQPHVLGPCLSWHNELYQDLLPSVVSGQVFGHRDIKMINVLGICSKLWEFYLGPFSTNNSLDLSG